MKASQLGQIGHLMTLVTDLFRKRGGTQDVQGEYTTEPFTLDGVTVQATISIEVRPVDLSKTKAA